MALIEAERLTKKFRQAVKEPGLFGALKHLFTQTYQDKVAVDQIDLAIAEGEAVAYIGPNGAGKSTTIKMITGILVPTSGTVMVDGIVPSQDRIANSRNIGAVFGQRTQLWWDIPIIESFLLLKDMYEIRPATYQAKMKTFSELLGIDEFLHLPSRKLSLGQRMRADLAAALLHDPKIVYLDEPTIGLDSAVKVHVREFIKSINQQYGTTVMLTTHDLADIEDICSRIIIIDHGRIIYDGQLAWVKNTFAQTRTLHIRLRQAEPIAAILLNKFSDSSISGDASTLCSVTFNRFRYTAGEILSFIMQHVDVLDVTIDEPAIEEVIRKVYEGAILTTTGAREESAQTALLRETEAEGSPG